MTDTWIELGLRVAETRELLRATQAELAAHLGIDRSAVCRMERGERKIDSLELGRIAGFLRQPLHWFLEPHPPAIVSRRHAREGVRHPADLALEVLASDVEQLQAQGLLRLWSPDLPGFALADVRAPERAAQQVRSRLGLGDDPIEDPQDLAEQLGMLVFVMPLEPPVDGSYVALRSGGVALVQGDSPPARRRFTVAHELGHHLVQDEYDPGWLAGSEESERLVNAFAIHLLVPRGGAAAIWEQHGDDPWDAAVRIGGRYGASWSALCSQLHNLDLVDDTLRADLEAHKPGLADFIEREIRLPGRPESPSLPRKFSAAVVSGCRRGILTRERGVELLRGTVATQDLPMPRLPPLDALAGELGPF